MTWLSRDQLTACKTGMLFSTCVGKIEMRSNAPMLQWDSCTLTNAVHVVRIPGIPDQEQLRPLICKTLKSRSLTSLTLNNDGNLLL